MNRKHLFGFILVLMVLASNAQAQELRDLIKSALAYNPAVRVSRETITKAEYERQSLAAQYMPLLALDSSCRYVSEVASMTLPAIPPKTIQTSTHENYDLGIGLSYLVFNGNAKESSLQIKDIQLNVAQLQLRKQQREIAYNVARLYRNIQILILQKTIIQTGWARTFASTQRLKSLRTQGMALEIDQLNLELLLARYDQQLSETGSLIDSSLDQLKLLAGNTATVTVTTFNATSDGVFALQPELNEDLRILELKTKTAELYRLISSSKDYPEIALSGAYRYAKPGVNPIANDWMSYYVLGASLRFNLWDFGAAKLTASANAQDAIIFDKQADYLKEQIRVNYNTAVREKNVLIGQQSLLQKSVDFANRKLLLAERQYEQGQGTAIDLKNADLDLTEAELIFAQQRGKIEQKNLDLEYLSAKAIEDWRL